MIVAPADAPGWAQEFAKRIDAALQEATWPFVSKMAFDTAELDAVTAARFPSRLAFSRSPAGDASIQFSDGGSWTDLKSGATSAVPTTRTLTAATGLTGGGDLSADRSFAIADVVTAAGPVGDSSHVPAVTFNAQGQLTTVSNVAISPTAIGGVPSSRLISAGTGLTGGGDLSADRTLTLANTAVTTGSYGDATHVATFMVDQQGRLTAAGSSAITFPAVDEGALALTGGVEGLPNESLASLRQIYFKPGTGLAGGGTLNSQQISFALSNQIAAGGPTGDASHVAQITYNAQGQLTAVASVAITPSAVGAVPTTRTLTAGTGLSGGGDLSADRSFALANTAVTLGSYGDATHVATFTVDQQGRLTAAGSSAITYPATDEGAIALIAGIEALQQDVHASIRQTFFKAGTGLTGGGTLNAPQITFGLANQITAAGPIGDASHVTQVTYNAQGQLTAVSSVAITPSAIGAVPTSRTLTASTGLTGGGDLSADRSFALANTAVTAGSYGDANNYTTFTVDAQGRLTHASTAAVPTFAFDEGQAGLYTSAFAL